MMIADSNNNTTLAKKEVASSASEALAEIVFDPDQNITGPAP